jgi:hypothetical protein
MRRRWRLVLATALLAPVLYVGSYLVWSRCFSWGGDHLWAFFQPPGGLMSFDLVDRYNAFGATPDEGWKRLESIPGTVYYPCTLLDEQLTGRVYIRNSHEPSCFS